MELETFTNRFPGVVSLVKAKKRPLVAQILALDAKILKKKIENFPPNAPNEDFQFLKKKAVLGVKE